MVIRVEIIHEGGDRRAADPPIGKCDCGARVVLDDCMTNACARCGALYNGSGQRLADPACWGEETGEHPADLERELGLGRHPK